MSNELERIARTPLKADRGAIKVAADGYHVTTISFGMNDRHAYATMFAASLDTLAALKALVDWGREHTSPSDPNSPHDLLIAGVAAIAKAEGRTTS